MINWYIKSVYADGYMSTKRMCRRKYAQPEWRMTLTPNLGDRYNTNTAERLNM
ncbi:Uncharacterised protein [Vibrio cholerae]|nr:Uncharacterised protein [Vibrio cholerae]